VSGADSMPHGGNKRLRMGHREWSVTVLAVTKALTKTTNRICRTKKWWGTTIFPDVCPPHTNSFRWHHCIRWLLGGAKNDGHKNDGPSKLQGMKLQDIKLQDMTIIDSVLFNFVLFFLYCDADVAAIELCSVIMKWIGKKDPIIGYTWEVCEWSYLSK